MFRHVVGLILSASIALVSCSSGDMISPVARGALTPETGLSGSKQPELSGDIETAKLTTTSENDHRPNVLLITIDTLRADRLRSYGNARISTPTFDAVAGEGIRFSRAYVQFSQTNPSHASLLTGTYASTHGLKTHGMDIVAPTVTTLAEVLANEGYSTGAIYSWPSLDPEFSGLDRGFDSYQSAYFPIPGKENEHLWRKMTGRADLTTDMALGWLSGTASEPFFLWVHYQDPHYPFTPPPPYDSMYDPDCPDCADGGYGTIDKVANGESISERDVEHLIALYDGAITFTDHQIGRLLGKLRQDGIEDNTLIIITGDHGESFGENGVWLHPYILYNTTLRVPLLMRYPQSMPRGLVIDSVVQSIDVMPTILETLDIAPPEMDGATLWPLISGHERGNERVAIAEVPDNSIISIIDGRWKLIRDNRDGYLALFDLEADPRELTNVASKHPGLAEELKQRLMVWMGSHGLTPER